MARDDAPDSGPLWRGHLQQVRQHQGLLSHQRGQGDQGDRLHRDAQRGQSHHGGLCCLLCQQGQEGQGVQHFPGWGELRLSESSRFWSIPEASVRPTTLLTACVPLLTDQWSLHTDTYRGAGGTDSASSTWETSSTLETRTKKRSEGEQPLTRPSCPTSKRCLGEASAESGYSQGDQRCHEHLWVQEHQRYPGGEHRGIKAGPILGPACWQLGPKQ